MNAWAVLDAASAGLSPRERGNRSNIFPASALSSSQVYPRASGGTMQLRIEAQDLDPPRRVYPRASGGTVPSRATRSMMPLDRVYPRASGGTE